MTTAKTIKRKCSQPKLLGPKPRGGGRPDLWLCTRSKLYRLAMNIEEAKEALDCAACLRGKGQVIIEEPAEVEEEAEA
jgi:hypothetical protein